jgi:ATP-dependent protease HslVU (ClpYQ) ATPase subunit
MEAHREKEKERLKRELELQTLKKEKAAKEEAARVKKEAEEAVEKFKIEEAKKKEKEKKEKEEREKEYKLRLEEDLRKSGMDERQIAVVLKKDQAVDPNRPTYTRMSRRHLSIETLNRYRIDYEFDVVRSHIVDNLKQES